MKRVGLHIRLHDVSLVTAAQKALRCKLPLFQCFFVHPTDNHLIRFTDQELALFKRDYAAQFSALYVHASYWVNLAGFQGNGLPVFMKELSIATKAGFTHIVLHPGTAKGWKSKMDSIGALAKILNKINSTERDVRIVLENTAHANLSVGSDLHDFALLREKLDKPELISFALDTAHAYVYGYDIATPEGLEDFFLLVDTTIGFDSVAVLHLNDSVHACGSFDDKHAAPGTGYIGWGMLYQFATDKRVAHIPVVLELPMMSEVEEYAIIDLVRTIE